MSRYRGPRVKVLRRLGCELPGFSRKRTARLTTPPGQQGFKRKRTSPYAERLQEKQKLRFNYGISERQMRRLFKLASRKRGDTGENLVSLLETRLDNIVFRSGFAPTIPSARQLVSHGHVLLNGRKTDIASCQVRPGDVVMIRERSRSKKNVLEQISSFGLDAPSFISVDAKAFSATLVSAPDVSEFTLPINTSLVVEFYSR
ncbi:MAG: 30S ribosomal protein S4 [Planctomycetota bacterium]